MAKSIHRLSPRGVATIRRQGYHGDGGGLYLQVSPSGTKSWIFRFTLNGRAREMGLGSLATYSLADARDRARERRQQLDDGIDPIEARGARKAQARLDAAKSMTFADCAAKYIAAHRAGWRNAKHASQWENTLATYAEPVLGSLPVQSIDVGLVLRVLEPIWHDKPETASRLRGRIEAILDWATVRGLRAGDNPARWRGHLQKALPARSDIRKVKHHSALPYADMPTLMASLREHEGVAARALEFTILNAVRTGEVIGATWGELDLAAKIWTIPAERMKAQREHRVPLAPRSVAILKAMEPLKAGEFVFPGARAKKPLSNTAMLGLLKRAGRDDLTVHGFRSSFRDWAAESTNYPHQVAEMALAHTVADKTEAAYRRGDLLDQRRALMNAWAAYCEAPRATGRKVVQIRRKKAA